MEQSGKRDSSFFLGMEFLRLWGAMAVVWLHYGPFRMPGVTFAVPCFVVMSFFLSWKMIDDKDSIRLLKRIQGLVIPFFSWGCISYLIAILIGNSAGLAPLLWQLCLGHATCTPLYYLFDVTVIMTFIFVLRKCLVRWAFCIAVALLVVICLFMQYSGLNHFIFGRLPFEASYPLGRIAELFPHAVMGCTLASINRKGWRSAIIGIILVGAGLLMVSPFRVPLQFGYAGLAPLFVASGLVSIVTAWTVTPGIFSWVRTLSSTTAGIYYIHCTVGAILTYFGRGSYLLVLLASFFIVLLGLHVPGLCMLFNGRHRVLLNTNANKIWG